MFYDVHLLKEVPLQVKNTDVVDFTVEFDSVISVMIRLENNRSAIFTSLLGKCLTFSEYNKTFHTTVAKCTC